jgi:hypothetical protein
MSENNTTDKRVARPVERHLTAAWAGIEKQKPGSNVTIPSMDGVIEAKEYVDSNQK